MNLEYLKSILSYCENTGELIWRLQKSNNIKKGQPAGQVAKNQSGKKYKRIVIDGNHYMAHRVVWFYLYGCWPSSQIDHIDGNGLNNKRCNLRSASIIENSKNRRRPKNNTSGVVGVSKNKNKWMAFISNEGRKITIGRFHDKFEAICARKSAENRFNYHSNHGTDRDL